MLITPSLNSLFITGFLILLTTIIIITNFSKIFKLDYYKKIILLCLLVITFGIHGLLHSSAEINYNFNPYKYIYM